MEDQSANSVANRNEPIPVISPPNSSGNDDAKSKQHKHKRSGSRSLQDRLFTKYANVSLLPVMELLSTHISKVSAADVPR